MYPRWRKHSNPRLADRWWVLNIGRFRGEVFDGTPDGIGFIGRLNNERVTQKFQRTARQAKVVVLLAIRRECKDVLYLTDHMNTKY
ncbi:hypothetical protein LCGC14_1776430 [marine sediment metagenome]|uniref:Uncharacterized protein n=1 Tax=marine sediment metagenome TaxID=412755 RepID=A0A0F9GWL1_9ZZZZ